MAKKKTNRGAKVEEPAISAAEPQFSVGQLLAFQRYRGRGDLLLALLNEKKKYTVAEADAAIERFMKGKVY